MSKRLPDRPRGLHARTVAVAVRTVVTMCLTWAGSARAAGPATAPAEPFEAVGKVLGECRLSVTPFPADSAAFVTQTADDAVQVWDGQALRPLTKSLRHAGLIVYRLSADHRTLMTAGGTTVRLWDVAGSKVRSVTTVSERGLVDADLSPDGARFLTVSGDDVNTFCVWNAGAGRPAFTIRHEGQVEWAGFSPDGKLVASDAFKVGIRIRSVETGQPVRALIKTNFYNGLLHCPQFDASGKRLLASTADGFVIADTTADKVLAEEKAQGGFADDARFVAGDNKVALDMVPQFGRVRMYDAATGKFERQIESFTCQTDPRGRWALGEGLGPESTPAIWDLSTGVKVQTLATRAAGSLTPIRMSPDGMLILVETERRVTSVWRLREPKHVAQP